MTEGQTPRGIRLYGTGRVGLWGGTGRLFSSPQSYWTNLVVFTRIHFVMYVSGSRISSSVSIPI